MGNSNVTDSEVDDEDEVIGGSASFNNFGTVSSINLLAL